MQRIDFNWIISKTVILIPPVALLAYLVKIVYKVTNGTFGQTHSDFLYYRVASSLVLEGNASIIYDFSAFLGILEQMTGNPFPIAWFYPPIYIFMVWPLSLLPYNASLFIWLLIPLSGLITVVYKIAPNPRTILICIAFPATLINFDYGQNGLISAVLLGWGLFLLDRRPAAAGIFLGLLSYKPQLAVLIPLALVASHNWRALTSAFVTFASFSILSVIFFGYETWTGFYNNITSAGEVLQQGSQGFIQNWAIMITPYSLARLLDLPPAISYLIQGLSMLSVSVVTYWVWSRYKSAPLRNSVLVICTLMFTPHAFEYDSVILALPMAWIAWEGYTKHWLRGEKVFLIIIWLSLLLSKVVIKFADFQIIPLIIGLFLFLAIRRLLLESKVEALNSL
jgi:hypothetical protein